MPAKTGAPRTIRAQSRWVNPRTAAPRLSCRALVQTSNSSLISTPMASTGSTHGVTPGGTLHNQIETIRYDFKRSGKNEEKKLWLSHSFSMSLIEKKWCYVPLKDGSSNAIHYDKKNNEKLCHEGHIPISLFMPCAFHQDFQISYQFDDSESSLYTSIPLYHMYFNNQHFQRNCRNLLLLLLFP